MTRGLILHTALLLGNIAVFGLTGGPSAKDGGVRIIDRNPTYADAHTAPGRQAIDADSPVAGAEGLIGGDLAAALTSLRKEQSRLRDEITKLKPPSEIRQAASAQQQAGGSHCNETSDNAPGVTVYLETAPAEAPSDYAGQAARQWTSVSFKEVGAAPDGSKQAVMSIQKTELKNGSPDFIPVRAAPHWQ